MIPSQEEISPMEIRMTAEEYNRLYKMATTNIESYRNTFVNLLQEYVATNKLSKLYEKASMSYELGDRYAISQFKKELPVLIWDDFMDLLKKGYPEHVGVIEVEDTTAKKDKTTKRRRRERNAA